MKFTLFIFTFCCLSVQFLLGQYKFDNKLYRTIYLEDLCQELKKSPNALRPYHKNETTILLLTLLTNY